MIDRLTIVTKENRHKNENFNAVSKIRTKFSIFCGLTRVEKSNSKMCVQCATKFVTNVLLITQFIMQKKIK